MPFIHRLCVLCFTVRRLAGWPRPPPRKLWPWPPRWRRRVYTPEWIMSEFGKAVVLIVTVVKDEGKSIYQGTGFLVSPEWADRHQLPRRPGRLSRRREASLRGCLRRHQRHQL